MYEAAAARALGKTTVKPIRDACSLYARRAVPIADACSPVSRRISGGAPFADGKSWKSVALISQKQFTPPAKRRKA